MMRWRDFALVLPAFLLAVPLFLGTSPYLMHLAILAGIYVILASGLSLVVGHLGLLSLCQPAFFGAGAYVSALLSLRLGMPFWVCLVAAAAFTLVLALVIGPVALRLSTHSFAMVTLGFNMIIFQVTNNWVELTAGPMGLENIPRPSLSILHFSLTVSSLSSYYYLVLLLAAASTIFLVTVINSRVGRAIIALRENETLAMSVGIDPQKYKVVAFAIGALLAGIAGSFYAHYTTYIDPYVFDFYFTMNILIMLIIGGADFLPGIILMSCVFTIVPEALRISREFRFVAYGIMLILIVIYTPKGIFGRIRKTAQPQIETKSDA